MGEDVVALGFPLGQTSLKISKGNVAGNEIVSGNLCIQPLASDLLPVHAIPSVSTIYYQYYRYILYTIYYIYCSSRLICPQLSFYSMAIYRLYILHECICLGLASLYIYMLLYDLLLGVYKRRRLLEGRFEGPRPRSLRATVVGPCWTTPARRSWA